MRNLYFKILLVIFLLILFFFSEYTLGLPVVFLFPVFLVLYYIFYFDLNINRIFFKFDAINLIFITLILYNLFIYISHIDNSETLENNYKYVNSSNANYIYIKTAFNGLYSILFFYLAYNTGRYIKSIKLSLYFFLRIVFYFCLINAISNIYIWFISTGGVIGRYNFKPALVASQGISVQNSILGFIILLSTNNIIIRNKIVKIIFKIVLLLSILIIFSRQPQIIFVLILLLYYYYKINNKSNSFKLLYLISIPFIIITTYFIYSRLGLIEIFQQSLDTDSIDVLVRIESFNEALHIFYNNYFFGVGHGMFALYNKLIVPVAGEQGVMTSPHNGIASSLSELGLIGSFILIILLFILYKKIFIINKQKEDLIYMIRATFIVYTLSLIISNFFLLPPPTEYIYYAFAFIFWVIFGYLFEENKTAIYE